jgi:threonine/homoserine efflux transporter RhtA
MFFIISSLEILMPNISKLARLNISINLIDLGFCLRCPPSHAAIILSLEAIFAAIGGWLMLNEQLGNREILGCGLMLLGMLVTQYRSLRRKA